MAIGGARTYSIGEVSQLLGVKAHTIRYWEREVSYLHPRKNVYGRRSYTAKELSLLHRLRHLVYECKYTVEGARERLWRELSDAEQDARSHISVMRAELLEARSRLQRSREANGAGITGTRARRRLGNRRGHAAIMNDSARTASGDSARDVEQLRRRFTELAQDHLFAHWERRDRGQQERLLHSLAALEPDRLQRLQEALQSSTDVNYAEIRPAPVLGGGPADGHVETQRGAIDAASGEHASPDAASDRSEWAERGRAEIAAGRCGFLTVAGGQGTRLGFSGPKGAFPVTPIRKASLFQVFAEKLLAAGVRYGVPVPWYIMTSPLNHDATRSFFVEHDYFGLDRNAVRFFPQGVNPALTEQGKLILAPDGGLLVSPDGHGGVLSALAAAAADDIAGRGLQTLFYFQVDNPLVTVPDPAFLGAHLATESQISTKVVSKRNAEEKLGLACEADGSACIVEYSDIDTETAAQRTDDGQLRFRYGSIAIHLLDTKFAADHASTLPLHLARKNEQALIPDADGGHTEQLQVIKFEQFVFDAIPLAKSSVFFAVDRAEEFAPLKNRDGDDSIDTCLAGQSARAMRWLRDCGVAVSERVADGSPTMVEVTPRYAPDVETLRRRLDGAVTNIDDHTLLDGEPLPAD